jgi:eukaryotic-like serine/threonine-protein kinase
MDIDRWRQVTGIFHAALSQKPADRDAYLATACEQDASLCAEVKVLLAAHAEAGEFGASLAVAPAPEHWAQLDALYRAARPSGADHRESLLSGVEPGLRTAVDAMLAADGLADPAAAWPWPGPILPDAALPPLASGTHLGRYRIEALVGRGGMGVVYKAFDARLDRAVAIKVLPPERVADPDRERRFVQEAKSASALNHPNIVTVHDVRSDGGVLFIAMEYVEGRSLADLIGRKGLPLSTLLDIAAQIADALAAAHARGMVHRDLKPANVMVTPDGRVKVLDFGLAKLVEEVLDANLDGDPAGEREHLQTFDGRIAGTPSYMSPEQALGRPVDARTDVFSFGSVLYEMAAGRRAFGGQSAASTLSMLIGVDPPPVRAVREDMPLELERLIQLCLRKDPSRRLQSIADLRLQLEAFGRDPAPGTSTAGDPGGRARRSPMGPLRGLARGVAAPVVMLALIGSAWVIRGPAPPRTLASPVQFTVELPAERTVQSVAFAPDGQAVGYTALEAGQSRVFIRQLGEMGAGTALGGTEGASGIFFSPDGRSIGFFANGILKKVPARGGAAVSLCDAPGSGAAGSWTTDGRIVFATDQTAGLRRVRDTGGAPETLTTAEWRAGELNHLWPQVLPGHRGVIFTILTGLHYDPARISVLDLGTSQVRPLVGDARQGQYLASGHLAFARGDTVQTVRFNTRDYTVTGDPVTMLEGVHHGPAGRPLFAVAASGDLVYFQARPEAPRGLYRVSRSGRIDRLAVLPPGVLDLTSMTRDGQQLGLLARERRRLLVHLYNWRLGTQVRWPSLVAEHLPIWSPDDSRLVFSSTREGPMNLFLQAADGSGPAERLTRSPQHQDPASWSPDGDRIAYAQADPHTGWDVWIVDVRTRDSTVFRRSQANEYNPMISPHGRWLAYSSDESGRRQVYVEAFPGGGGRKQVSPDGGDQPAWSRDGRELFFRRQGEVSPELWSAPVNTRPNLQVGRAARVLSIPHWATTPRTWGPPAYLPTQDGQHFFVIRMEPWEEPPERFAVVLDWRHEVKARLSPRSARTP